MKELWSELNNDLLEEIAGRLDSYDDYLHFRAVCASWRSALPERPTYLRCPLPLLLLPPVEKTGSLYGLFSLSEKKVYTLDSLSPVAGGKVFRGSSSHGWLITMEEEGPTINLINPLTRHQIQLPPLYMFPDVVEYCPDKPGHEYVLMEPTGRMHRTTTWSYQQMQKGFLDKIVLSKDQCIAMAIYGEFCKLAFCRRGDQRWTLILYAVQRSPYDDIIFCKGKFFAVRCNGMVIACDFNTGSSPIVTQMSPPPSRLEFRNRLYLVESSGEILLIARHVHLHESSTMPEIFLYKTVRFRVFKLEQDQMNWSQLRSIGDQTLFLGFNSSLSFSSRDFPELKGNCIYFSDDKHSCHTKGIIGGFDVGIYNLEKDFIEPLPEPLPSYMGDSQLVWPPPIWVTPNLC